MRHEYRAGTSLDIGCVRLITRSTRNLARSGLTAEDGRRDGGLDLRMAGVGRWDSAGYGICNLYTRGLFVRRVHFHSLSLLSIPDIAYVKSASGRKPYLLLRSKK